MHIYLCIFDFHILYLYDFVNARMNVLYVCVHSPLPHG